MNAERETVITQLKREMQEAPLSAPALKKPERRVLADGYERQTDEETMYVTAKYRHRTVRAILRWSIILLIVTLLVMTVIKAGIISI